MRTEAYLVEFIHIIYILICIYVPLFSDNIVALKLVIMAFILTMFSWHVFGECPVFKFFTPDEKPATKIPFEIFGYRNMMTFQMISISMLSAVALYKI